MEQQVKVEDLWQAQQKVEETWTASVNSPLVPSDLNIYIYMKEAVNKGVCMYSKLCKTAHIFAPSKGGACFCLDVTVNTLTYHKKDNFTRAQEEEVHGMQSSLC